MNAQAQNFSPNPQIDSESSGAPEAVGPLRGQVWLTIQTRQAQQLVRGRTGTPDKPPIIGLVGFADRLRVIWQAARNDDPYADWWLIKVHEGIEAAGTLIRDRQQALESLLQQMGSIEVTTAASLHPFRMPLQFANPYAYQGAKHLSAYDTLVCTALTAHHIGLLDRAACQEQLNISARKIRALFAIPQRYRFLGIDRPLIRQGTAESERAGHLMGALPADVLSGERQAPLVPRKVRFPSGFGSNTSLHSKPSVTNPPPSDSENETRP
ncbi:MAG: TIGR03761 family integrating conjugative element protein [Gammaproteobacteria bacterium]|nr:TIGR03761 family integrating conjugative element protein [Gammaproteobacteria bacterium]